MKQLILLLALTAAAYAEPLIYMTSSGGGGSLDPSATNAVLVASKTYTDTKTAFNHWADGIVLTNGTSVVVENGSTPTAVEQFVVVAGPTAFKCLPRCVGGSEVNVFIREAADGKSAELYLTSATTGEIEFVLVLTCYEVGNPGHVAVKTYNCKRTF